MSKPLVDAQVRDRIRTELDRNQLVEAGAGSGKTEMMAQRMAAGIASGAYTVEHMAAVTFTRKAAAELRGRFQLALEGELRKATGDAARQQRLGVALSNIERFFAGTIHSFCAHLLRERPVEAGVAPGFTEIDEVEDKRLRRQSWRDFRTQLKAAGDPDMLELIDAGIKPADLDRAFDTVCLFEEVEFPAGEAPKPDPADAWKALDRFWTGMQVWLPRTLDPETTCRTQQAAARFIGLLRVVKDGPRDAKSLADLLELWSFEPKIVQMRWTDDPKKKKELGKVIPAFHADFKQQTVDPFLEAWRRYLYRLSIGLLSRARLDAAKDRKRLNTLNYGDLLQMAARVLRENATVREALAAKYRWVFVDEFQDTDPVQAEIMLLLAATPGSGAPADWRTVDLRPGSLFVVGDPKQSIYRFRRADIDIYNEVRDRIGKSASGDVLPLTSNFRSKNALCEWANDVFVGQFPATATREAPAFARLDPADNEKPVKPALFTLTVPETVDRSEIPQYESQQIARYIRSEVEAGRRSYGDFLILTRKRKALDVYAHVLEEHQIPIEVSGAGAFGQSEQVAELTRLLRALADPQDGVTLVGVLRGPLFGISDRDLFAYRQAGGWFSIFSALSPSDAGAQRVATAIASLRQMHRWTQTLPIGGALERILEHTGYLALAAATPGGVEAGDLLHAVDRVRAVVESGYTLADAADALEPDADEPGDVESLPLEPGRIDVVRVMNLHKAKGLEAPVVFLANPMSGVKPRVDARVIRDGNTARGYFKIMRDFGQGQKEIGRPADWDRYEEEEKQYLVAEGTRLLYVAATRAKEALIVGRYAKGGSGRPWEMFDGHLKSAQELGIPSDVKLTPSDAIDMSADAVNAAWARQREAHEHAMRATWSARSVTTETKAFPKTEIDVPVEPDDPSRVLVTETPSRRADAGAAWGALIHGLLEHALRHHTVTREDLMRLAVWLTVDEPTLRPHLDLAVDTARAVAKKEFWAEAEGSAECLQEVPFAMVTKDDVGRPKIVNGTIDSVYRAGDGWKIVDYKTDVDGTPEVLNARYGKQLAAYVEAWQSLTGDKVSSLIVPARVPDAKG